MASMRKKVIYAFGKPMVVQGYEPKVILDLQTKGVACVSTDGIPTVPYSKTSPWPLHPEHRYFPDLVVTKRNGAKVVVEVKSLYTLRANFVMNMQKFRACRQLCQALDFTFVLALVDDLGEIHYIRNPSERTLAPRLRSLSESNPNAAKALSILASSPRQPTY